MNLKAVGSNPLHFGLRIQQLVQQYRSAILYTSAENHSKDQTENGVELVNPSDNW